MPLLVWSAGCNCRGGPVVLVEDCENGVDDDKNDAADCDDPVCFYEYHCRAMRADSGVPDAGPPDAGFDAGVDAGFDAGFDAGIPTTYASACPGLAYTPSCGPDAGTGWRKVVPRATNGLFTTVWAPRDGGDVFVGGTSVHRWNGSVLTDDIPDAGAGLVLYATRLEGAAANDLWLTTSEAQDGTRLMHRTDAGWSVVAHDRMYFANDLALINGTPWVLAVTSVARVSSDGGFAQVPLPPGTFGLFLSTDPNGEVWVGGQANPCPNSDGGICPRVVHGVPGVSWHVDDWPCLTGNGGAYVWRRTPNEQVFTGGGFIARRIDGGWTQPESVPFSGARVTGTANDAWMTAYDLFIGSQSTGVAHFNGCVEAPIFLYTTQSMTNAANGLTYSGASGGASDWAAAASWDNAQMKWRGELWTNP